MIQDTKTIYEHWTDDDLRERADNPEHADPGMLESVRQEIERRAKVREDRERIERQAAEAKRKQQDAEKAEADQKKLEKARKEMLDPRSMHPDARQRLAGQLSIMAKQYYMYGGFSEAFMLDALAMAARGERTAELVELFRDSEWSERWSMTHPTEPRVIVYFGEVFPAKVKKMRAASPA